MADRKSGDLFEGYSDIYRLIFTIADRMQQFMYWHQKKTDNDPDRHKKRIDRSCSQPIPLYIDDRETAQKRYNSV